MKTMTHIAAAICLLAALGCASGGSLPAQLSRPELRIVEIGGRPGAAENVTGPLSVNLAVEVANTSSEPIVLERLQVQSVGMGAYEFPSTTRPFDKQIAANSAEVVSFWIGTNAPDTVVGNNGPVTIRTTAFFNSEFGRFREVYTHTVNASARSRESI